MFSVKDSTSERSWLVYNPFWTTLMKKLNLKTTFILTIKSVRKQDSNRPIFKQIVKGTSHKRCLNDDKEALSSLVLFYLQQIMSCINAYHGLPTLDKKLNRQV